MYDSVYTGAFNTNNFSFFFLMYIYTHILCDQSTKFGIRNYNIRMSV